MKKSEINDSTARSTFLVSFGKRLFLFCCVTVICMCIGGLIVGLIASKGTTPAIRMSAILQDIMLFILPALVTACLITRFPARFLLVDRKPELVPVLLAIAILFASVPLMNKIVAWNESLMLPAYMSELEAAMRASEESARALIDMLIGPRDNIGGFIIAVLIVGVTAGFSEEIFFRGTLQRLLATGPVNANLAIWITAFIFSAIHFQFYGFVPRLLLGAYFGYLLWWTRSLWVPVIVHITNNVTVVTCDFFKSGDSSKFDTIGTEPSEYMWVGVSAIAVILLLWCFRSISKHSDR